MRAALLWTLTSALVGCDGARIAPTDSGSTRDDGAIALDARGDDVADVGLLEDAPEPDDAGAAPDGSEGPDAAEPMDAGPMDAGPEDAGAEDAGEPDASDEILLSDGFEDSVVDSYWTLWRTQFVEAGDRLSALPAAREGFLYGHGGNGRSGIALTHLGDADWRDYRVETRIRAHGPDPSFNPAGIADCDRGLFVWLRVARAAESWNEAALTTYAVFVRTDGCAGGDEAGTWGVYRYNDFYYAGTGCCANMQGLITTIASGSGALTVPDDWNDVVVEMRGLRIRAWVGGELAIDVTDDAAGSIAFGGVAIVGLWENPFDIERIRVVEID